MRKRDKVKMKFSKALEFSLPMLVGSVLTGIVLTSCEARGDEIVECEFFDNLTPYQIDVANQAYKAGLPYDLGLTAVAIGWEESRLGLYKARYNTTNIKDQSFGVMHTVAIWKTKDMNSFEAGIWVQDMVSNDQKSIDVGVQDILYWQNAAKGDWLKGVGMYNGGWRPNEAYGQLIVKTVKKLKECQW